MGIISRAISVAMITLGIIVPMENSAFAEPFDFVALGDTAYNVPEDYPVYEALIETINNAEPAFSIHVGDIVGVERCTDAMYEKHLAYFQTFDHPLIYTPGDNEWVDCQFSEPRMQDPETGALDMAGYYAGAAGDIAPDRLNKLRSVFFSEGESLGTDPLPLHRQSDDKTHPQMVENARWTHDDVLFATFHVSGSLNGLTIVSEESSIEAIGRNRANVAWLDSTFAEATEKESKAIVIVLHADMFETVHAEFNFFAPLSSHNIRGGSLGPFYWFARRLADLADNFEGQILIVHGDSHVFIVDQPMTVSRGEGAPPLRQNVTRLQVFGAPEIKAVQVTVDTDTPWVFSFSPLYN
ncbi:MAG: hypothetical protein HN793_04140 [Rhodospirillaceae bacterium]|nr:hypothetical protein [Rhodospirillaceae bacterium]MBT7449997.1 hypothetical protein [Rhodospirillaceae bacterium]